MLAIISSRSVWSAETVEEVGGHDDRLDEIVVTAEKRSSTIQETAISMSALSGAQLETKGITSVEDLAGAVPGISMRTAGPGQTEYEMRGLASSGGSVATVGFYLDDTPLSASAAAANGRTVIDPDLFDLNHVEVLRGPQGTLYGAGSMGGTIRLVTNPPKLGTFEGAAEGTGSKTDGGGVNGGGDLMLNIPIGDAAALRVVAAEKYISGWIDRDVIKPGAFPFPTNFGNCGFYFCTRGNVLAAPIEQIVKDANLERFSSVRAALLVKPSDALSITGTLMYQRIDADGFNQYQSPPGPLTGSHPASDVYSIFQPYNLPEPYYDSFKLAALSITYDLPFAQFSSATSYWQRYVIQSQDSTEPLQNIFNLTAFTPTLYQEVDPTTQLSEELRLTSTGNSALHWVAGLYFADLHSQVIGREQSAAYANVMGCAEGISGGACPPGDSYNITNGGPAANPEGIIFNENVENVTKQSAVFGEASYEVLPKLDLTVGIRYFKFTTDTTTAQCGVGTGTGNATCQTGLAKGSGSNVLPKLNLAYKPTQDLTVYGTMSKGSRPGGGNFPIPLLTAAQAAANPGAYNCGPGSGPVFVTSQPSYYGPDSVWSYELGEKLRFDDQRFSFNADIYYIKWSQIQQLVILTCGYSYNNNVGTAHAYGPEAEFTALITRDLTVAISGTKTKADIYDPSAASGIAAGTQILNVPRYTGQLAFDYQHDIAGNFKVVGRLSDAYVGPTPDIAYYREILPAYNLIDGRLGIKRDSWAAYVVGTNLSNEHAALTIDNTAFAWQQSTITRAATNQPRTIGFDVQYKF